MYSTRSGLILGFHGCDQSVVADVITGKTSLLNSVNEYDWLGHGVYFWDNSPGRALEFAKMLSKLKNRGKGAIKKPAVIGAVIDLGFCLDLLDYQNLTLIKDAHEILAASYGADTANMPENKNVGTNRDLLLRELDCAVDETLHQFREDNGFANTIQYIKTI